jgi:steroid delta-isomerase
MRAIYLIVVAWLTAFAAPATAQHTSGDAEVRAALKQWMADFNAGRADKVCDIFAPALRADVDGFPERTFDVQCKVLQTVLADPEHSLSYALDIKEILADGDMAAVRLVWTLTVEEKGQRRDQGDARAGPRHFRPQQRRPLADHPLHEL